MSYVCDGATKSTHGRDNGKTISRVLSWRSFLYAPLLLKGFSSPPEQLTSKNMTQAHVGVLCVAPIWPCSQWGLPCRTKLLSTRCALTTPFHPYPLIAGRYIFCGTFPQVTLAEGYSALCFCGARTFLFNS